MTRSGFRPRAMGAECLLARREWPPSGERPHSNRGHERRSYRFEKRRPRIRRRRLVGSAESRPRSAGRERNAGHPHRPQARNVRPRAYLVWLRQCRIAPNAGVDKPLAARFDLAGLGNPCRGADATRSETGGSRSRQKNRRTLASGSRMPGDRTCEWVRRRRSDTHEVAPMKNAAIDGINRSGRWAAIALALPLTYQL
jgi:hypothetical protein